MKNVDIIQKTVCNILKMFTCCVFLKSLTRIKIMFHMYTKHVHKIPRKTIQTTQKKQKRLIKKVIKQKKNT